MKTVGERFDEMAEAAGVSKTDKSYYFGRSCCFQIATEQKAIDDERIAELEKEKASLVLEVRNKNKRIAELEAEVDKAVENRDYWKGQAIALKAKEKELIKKAKEWVKEFCTETNYAKDEIPIIVKSIELFMEE